MFFSCKQVSNHLSKEDYEKLSPFRKFTLKFHVVICPVCGAYNRQVMKFQDMARTFRQHEEEFLEADNPEYPHLDEETRNRLKIKLAEPDPDSTQSGS